MRPLIATLMLVLLVLNLTPPLLVESQIGEPLYLMIIWHYHQPWYYDATMGSFILPWVRMHSVGNYYKMAYILSKYPDVKTTFTFSGSLLAQILEYVRGGKMDYRQVISLKLAKGENLTTDEAFSMLQIPGGFFDINWNRIVNVIPKYRMLRDKAQEVFREYVGLPEDKFKESVVSQFTAQELLDLACLFNLFWIDPLVLREEFPELYKVREGYLRSPEFTCDRVILGSILEVQKTIMGRILGIYKELLSRGQIEVISVPYSHPLAPILVDLGFEEDLEVHVNLSLSLIENLLGYKPKGVWPAELAVNEDVFRVFSKLGVQWSITDDTILFKSVPNIRVTSIAGVNVAESYFWVLEFNGSKIYVFFRNSGLSDLIGFTYSTMRYDIAVNDLIGRLKAIASANPGGLIVIALDGENPWEHYEEFGDLFLQKLYEELSRAQRDGFLKTITPSEYIAIKGGEARRLPLLEHRYLDLRSRDISDTPVPYTDDAYTILPRVVRKASIAEGSWAGGELAIWIGQRQENAAWMLLVKARSDILKALGVNNLKEALESKPNAIRYILMAEASDWFWWYGGDGGGFFPSNILFKSYLKRAYEELGLEAPAFLETLFNPEGTPVGVLNTDVPRPVTIEPIIDGALNEGIWSEALVVKVGDEYVREVLVSVSSTHLIIGARLARGVYGDVKLAIHLTNPWRSVSPFNPGYNSLFRDGSPAPMGLFYEVLVDISSLKGLINVADGKDGWVTLFKLDNLALGDSLELMIPWHLLSLTPGDLVYLVVAVYRGNMLIERSDRVGLTHLIQVPRLAVLAQAGVVFEVSDPEGDDDGAGGYKYPLNPVFKPGVFDLVKFKVSISGDRVVFEVYVRNLGGNPWGGPNGFSMQYVHIYVRTTLNERGRSDTFGLNVNLSDDSRWHFAILLAPGWGSDPVPRGERAALYYFNGTMVVQDGLFKVYADPTSNSIVAEVSSRLLLDVDNIESWVYTVILTSYDGYGPERIRPFGIESQEWVIGTGAKYAQAILFNVIPRVMDILAPTKEAQYEMLNSFKIEREKGLAIPAIVNGVSKVVTVKPPQQVTITMHVTHVRELTITEYTVSPTMVTVTMRESPVAMIVYGFIAGLLIAIPVALILARKRG